MSAAKCQYCGRAYPRASTKGAVMSVPRADRDKMTDEQFRKYSAAVGLREDVAFYAAVMSRFGFTTPMRYDCYLGALALVRELETRKATPADRDQLHKWQDATRANPARPWRFAAGRDVQAVA